jgi:hypothetical protein
LQLKKSLLHVVSKQAKNYFIKKIDFYYNKQTHSSFYFCIKSQKSNL